MSKKRILCLIDCFGMGGAERQMIGLVLLLKQKGYDVDLVKYHEQDSYGDLVNSYGLDTITLETKESALSKLVTVRKFIKQQGGYDCVIAYKDGPCIIACLLKLMQMDFRLIVSERNTSQKMTVRERIKFLLYGWADYIVPNSFSQEHFIKENFPGLLKKTVTITNFTDTTFFAPVAKQPSDIVRVLTTARVARQKNILRYLDAISILRNRGFENVRFEWYGNIQSGQEDYWKVIQSKMSELRLEGYINFYPATKNVLEKYQQCDVFCLPSNYEGYPNVICEAMSCGKPIVCSRICDNPYIVQENENGVFFDNTDIKDIADKLQFMIEKPKDEIKQWGERSREIAEKLFSMQSFVEKYISLIEK